MKAESGLFRKKLPAVFAASALLVLLLLGRRFSDGVTEGLALAAGVFIPAMLPYYFVVGFLCESRAKLAVRKLLAPLCRRASLGGAAADVMLTGFLGGYPAGAMAVGELCGKGELDYSDADRLMLFCTNAGPGFVIGAVGQVMLGSLRAGVLLYAAHLLSSLTLAVIACRLPAYREKRIEAPPKCLGFFRAFTSGVTKACLSCLYAAGFIALACGAVAALSELDPAGLTPLNTVLCALFEVTKGCLQLSQQAGLPQLWIFVLLAAVLGFGGLSVLFQLASFCGGCVRFGRLLTARLLNALLGAAYCLLLCLLTGTPEISPSAEQTFAALSSAQHATAYVLIAVGLAAALAGQYERRHQNI